MGQRTYWQALGAAVPSPPLGDANRGMCPWPCKAAVSNCGKARRAYPPERRAFPLSGNEKRGFPFAAPGLQLHWKTVVKRLVLASPRGYCAGVERAVETVERALELHGAPVYVRKQIVHNAHVVRDLERRGAVFVDTVGEVPAGSNVVFSAHGVSPAVRHSARFRGLRAIDATCPLVSKVHVEARHFARLGYTIFLIGHAGHEEVEGTTGEAPQSILLVETAKQAETVVPPQTEKLVYLTQTTLSVGRYRRDRRDPPPPFPGRRGAQEGRHLLRDDEPAACRETNSLRRRSLARHRLAQQLELEPARRRRPRR